MIFDTHAHYDDHAFDRDRDELLRGLSDSGTECIVNVGSSMESTRRTLELAEKYPFIYAAIGVHPSETEELVQEDMDFLREQVRREKVVAVGEIGLDYHWKEPEPAVQKKWFERQLSLASEVRLPVVIHSRDAAKDTLDILKGWQKDFTGGVLHCFSYSREMAEEYLNMGYYFGIGGVLTFKNARKLLEAVEIIPMKRILLETDCPYLAPEPYRGMRNQSSYLELVAQKLAQIKSITKKDVLEQTMRNARKFYGIIRQDGEK